MTTPGVRFGLIGYGAWGQCHAEAIRKTDGAELVAIAAKSESTCASAREAFPEAAVSTDYRDLLARDDVDIVDVVLPSFLHHEVASAVLQAGKHLLLEKPMCLTVEQCDDLNRQASAGGRLLAIGHELRLSSLWSKVKQMIDEGFVGEPQYVLVELSRNPYRLGADGWRYDIDRVGNWILEEPIHFFDFARWYLSSAGEPVSVFATANSRQPNHPELQDNFSAIVKFNGGKYAVVSQSLSMFEHHQTVKVAGTKGSLWASWSGAMDRTLHPTFFLKTSDGETVTDIPIEKITGEVYELEDEMAMLVRAVRDDKPLMTTGADGKWSVAMCVAAQRSVETGNPVDMSEVLP
ncbi:Gfo/Idh/MocA family protein [Gimesia panareensis]|uniref:1,5-anhydro-D-fructose reductase n=1 Tax=Gimesia panareensis TaxID=2527978 RepID=A0A517ZZK3_9PLAN|nr:Gfo/Idh/MocA family oxidoreductase [Gimesia panareensis]QDT24927.1 1,5-anhydro-D-fructose reductase [Gimesia panareensis]QDU47908.1 1,5-anhydro-D-fructose reductase [Gimesia panareensis]